MLWKIINISMTEQECNCFNIYYSGVPWAPIFCYCFGHALNMCAVFCKIYSSQLLWYPYAFLSLVLLSIISCPSITILTKFMIGHAMLLMLWISIFTMQVFQEQVENQATVLMTNVTNSATVVWILTYLI